MNKPTLIPAPDIMRTRALDFFQQANVEYLEGLYEQYLLDPSSIDRDWALFFAGFEAGYSDAPPPESAELSDSREAAPRLRDGMQDGVQDLVHSYRELG